MDEYQINYQEKDWLSMYVQNGYNSYSSESEYRFVAYKMKKWERDRKIGCVMDGLLLGYILAVILYVLLYTVYNQAIIPKDGWTDWIAFAICGGFWAFFALVYGIVTCRNYLETYTVGTVFAKQAPQMRGESYILWVALNDTQLPVSVSKATFSIYFENERVVLYSLRKKSSIFLLHELSKKQRKQLRRQQNWGR